MKHRLSGGVDFSGGSVSLREAGRAHPSAEMPASIVVAENLLSAA